MAVAFSSKNLTERDRIPYWVDVATQAFFKHGFSARTDSFVGDLYADQLDTLGLARCDCSPCEVTRTRRDIARDGIDDLILCVRLSGRSHVTQGDREIVVDPGTLFLRDTGRPLKDNYLEQTTSIFVSIPRKTMQARIGNAALANSVSTKLPVAGLAAEFLKMLTARADTLEDQMKARLAEQALDLIVLALTAEGGSPALSSPRTTALMRLKTVIDAHLSDPNLKPDEAAAAAGISVRYANGLLAEEGFSVGRYIMHRRLERCRRAIEDPLQAHRMIGEIAYSWGFSYHSHFTRRFRTTFGMTPGDYRRQLQDRRKA